GRALRRGARRGGGDAGLREHRVRARRPCDVEAGDRAEGRREEACDRGQGGRAAADRRRRRARPSLILHRERVLPLGGPRRRPKLRRPGQHPRGRGSAEGGSTPNGGWEIQAGLAALGLYRGTGSGKFDAKTKAAFETWAEMNNYENKLRKDGKVWGSLHRALKAQVAATSG